jgi:predicted RNA-binding Zn-ribbon protein involved in translation (DUF1610 family)
MLTLTLVVRAVMIGFVLSIIGMFTQKKLNPRYEKLIEKRMNRVAYLALGAILFVLLVHVIWDIWLWQAKSTIPPLIVYIGIALIIVVLGVCSYLIAHLKNQGSWQSVVWAIFGATGTGLLALLLCANYYPIGAPPEFPIYRGRKITFTCESCGKHLSDYECNIGTEGICPKCGRSQIVSTMKKVREEKESAMDTGSHEASDQSQYS